MQVICTPYHRRGRKTIRDDPALVHEPGCGSGMEFWNQELLIYTKHPSRLAFHLDLINGYASILGLSRAMMGMTGGHTTGGLWPTFETSKGAS